MDRHELDDRFGKRIFAGRSLGKWTPAAGFDAVCQSYADERADGCDPHTGGDKLTVQWVTTEWYLFPRWERTDLRMFGIVMTRELVTDDPEDVPLAISLFILFEVTPELVALGKGCVSCDTISQLDEFRQVVRTSAVFAAIGEQRPAAVRIRSGFADRN